MSEAYDKHDIAKVRQAAHIADFIPGETIRKGTKTLAKCPTCNEHTLQVTDNLRFHNCHCFKCGFHLDGAFNVIEHFQSVTFPEAVRIAALRYGIPLKSIQEKRKEEMQSRVSEFKESFCAKQLEASGLTLEDVTARVRTRDGRDWEYLPTFSPGTVDYNGNVEDLADDMLIHYFDLEGRRMKVNAKSGKSLDYVRPRWSMPEAHKGKDGKAGKYGNIKGATARIYITQLIRTAYQEGRELPLLVIQEGEKKAEKACKHGIPSVAIQGIYNIGTKDTGLINDIQLIVKKCKVRKLLLLFDADWDDLSRNLQPGDEIDQRPKSFARAACKFKTYVDSLNYAGLSVDIYFGHINANDNDDKGIDDLLCGTLRGREESLADDITAAVGSVSGEGEFVTVHKISLLSDIQILNFWALRDKEEFFARHHQRIKGLGKIRFSRVLYIEDDEGSFRQASQSGTDKKIWNVFRDEKDKKQIEFFPRAALEFAQENGFALVRSTDGMKLSPVFIDKGIARNVPESDIRDFIWDYVMMNCRDNEALDYMFLKLGTMLNSTVIERMKKIQINEYYDSDSQNRYYANGQLVITADEISLSPYSNIVWRENVLGRSFERVPIFETVAPDGGSFEVRTTAEGARCEFLTFLTNVSNMHHHKDADQLTQAERDNILHHLVNKLTAIGFLLVDYHDPLEEKVIILMDDAMTEVGKSNGRSGKSLIGRAISHMVEQAYVDGKELSNSDEFMFSDVTPRSRSVFFDDVKPHFNFTRLFSAVTAKLSVNPKAQARFVIEYENMPKFMVTTNHAIDDDSNSARDRMVNMVFSDFYNIDHKPVDDFHHAFFTGWDSEQWKLFDNLMAECVQIYYRSRREGWVAEDRGLVPPPSDLTELRHLRQKMGETFLQWAELYYAEDSGHLNQRIEMKALYDSFCEDYPGQQRFVSITSFRERLQAFCRFSGLHYNANRRDPKTGLTFAEHADSNPGKSFVGDRDASGGRVYASIFTDDYANRTQR